MRKGIVCSLLLFLSCVSCLWAQAFQNLDFEAVQNIPVFDPHEHPWTMSAADALLGWTGFYGTNQFGWASYNDLALDSPAVGVMGSDSPVFSFVPTGLLGGQYCASLQAGRLSTGAFYPATIGQIGQIPSTAKSITFSGSYAFSVSFAGSPIPMQILVSEGSYNVYAGDISQFAGQTGNLLITSYNHFSFVDDIQFSPDAIPEPSAFGLTAGALMLLLGVRLRRPC
jgi:hypothetical protein